MLDGQPLSGPPLEGSAVGPRREVAVAVSIVVVVLAMALAAPVTGGIGGLLSSGPSSSRGDIAAAELRVTEAATGAFVPVVPLVADRIEELRRQVDEAVSEARAEAQGDRGERSGGTSSKSSVTTGEARASSSSEVRSSTSSHRSSSSGSSVSVSNSSTATARSSGSVTSSGSSTAEAWGSQEVSGDEASCYSESYTSAEVTTSEGVERDVDHQVSRTC